MKGVAVDMVANCQKISAGASSVLKILSLRVDGLTGRMGELYRDSTALDDVTDGVDVNR